MCSSVPPNSRICPRGSRVPRHAAPTEYFEVREMSSRYTKTCRWCQATYALERAKKRLRVLEGSTAPTRRSRCKRKPPIRGLRSRILRRISAHVAALEGRGWSRSNGLSLEYCSLPNRNKAEEFLSSLKQDWIQAGSEVEECRVTYLTPLILDTVGLECITQTYESSHQLAQPT